MLTSLYQSSIEQEKMTAVAFATQKARELPDEMILSHSIDNLLGQIGQKKMVFARLRIDERRGKRIGDKIEVTIPFDGWPKSLTIQPSRSVLIKTSARYDQDGIKVNFADDDNLDENVNKFTDAISKNLQMVQAEWPSVYAEAKKAATNIIETRKSELAALKARDSRRSFPID